MVNYQICFVVIFTLLDDTWWREPAHTPLNSSIVSWSGSVHHIWEKFWPYAEDYMTKYSLGSDEWYYKEIEYETYDRVCPKFILKKAILTTMCAP